ncbi:hypothetical protein PRNP1_002597 [Phytophthora ramorum]
MRGYAMATICTLLLLSLLSLPVRVYVNVSWCRRQEAGPPQSLQAADAVVVLRPLAGDQLSILPSNNRFPQALQIAQPGANYIAVNFERLDLLTGDKLVVRDPNGSRPITVVPGNASSLIVDSNKSPRSLLLRTHPFLVKGDTVVVEYIPSIMTLMLPMAPSQRQKAVVVMDSYAYVVDNSGSGVSLSGVDTESTVGATDEAKEAVCYRKTQPKMYAKARAVARLMIQTEEQTPKGRTFQNSEQVTSWTFCTGWLIGRGNHLLTNHHCMKDAATAEQSSQSWTNREKSSPGFLSNTFSRFRLFPTHKTGRIVEAVVGFMAETKSCRETGFMGERVGVVEATRVILVTENPELDYALLRVLTNDSEVDLARRYGFLRLRAGGPVDGEAVYIPQHPRGEPKEIAATKDGKPAVIDVLTASSGFVGRHSETSESQPTVLYNADTKPGSSGSPVLSRKDNTVVALHRAGSSEIAQSASTELFNMGVRIDLIARDLQRRHVLPRSALES